MKDNKALRRVLVINVTAVIVLSMMAVIGDYSANYISIPMGTLPPITGDELKIGFFFLLGGVFIVIFIEVFARYIGDVTDSFATVRNDVSKAVSDGIIRAGNRTLSIFDADVEKNIIYNVLRDTETPDPDDYVRNVMFDCRSIIRMLRAVSELSKSPDSAIPEDGIFQLGLKVGQRFGHNLVANIQDEKITKIVAHDRDLHAWLLAWAKYDSRAGWGKFEVSADKTEFDAHRSITLKHSFVVWRDEMQEEDRLCDFITGYIQGVISQFPNDILARAGVGNGVVVEHPIGPEFCAHASGNLYTGCIFLIQGHSSN